MAPRKYLDMLKERGKRFSFSLKIVIAIFLSVVLIVVWWWVVCMIPNRNFKIDLVCEPTILTS